MPVSFYDISVGTHLRGLKVLSRILDLAKAHAAAKNIPIDELVEWRLIEDMNPLSFQVQYVCKVAKNFLKAAAHLDIPVEEDDEKTLTFADLEACIVSTNELLSGVDRASVEGNEDKTATLPEASAKWGQFTGVQYLLGTNLPNFYFHLVTAYDILRAKGVELGKREYLRPHFASFVHN
ncbi:hypothetical protein V1520DRAFT_365251 [Lipomyces starkeyi]|uniref:DUF1993 domain-containing protein n=1 Tax=Lipomyces starkeyi NRRL Y-11557 TaxID=675824 RepID=A0A1E3Q175_LIPST|nr:hypothetical protein LIPSTDRAFT_73123 [Lipomyces starkeyi NRRL Y-11557]